MPERDGERSSGPLLISQLIRLAHQSQGKSADPFSDEGGKQVTRCPMPHHPDQDPSCVFNNDIGRTGHFFCRTCHAQGFGDELAQRLFPDKSYRDLLAEVRKLEDSAPSAGPSRTMSGTLSRMQPSVIRSISGNFTPEKPKHRLGLPQNSSAAEIDRRRQDLVSVNEAAARWYQAHLASPASLVRAAEPEILGKTYFRRRGIDDDTHAEFRLGYAPSNTSDDLDMHLQQRGFAHSLLLQADIFRSSKRNPNYTYSTFQGRAMIPMHNEEGQIIGFGGRSVDSPKLPRKEGTVAAPSPEGEALNTAKKIYSPKYMHTANIDVVQDTIPLFKKGDWFFNMHRARPVVSDAGRLLVVEGYLDVVGLHQAGIREVVSPIGVSLSETQLRRIWDLVDTPIICLDGDDAGRRAAGRIAAKAYAILDPVAAKALEERVAATLHNKPEKVLSDEERTILADTPMAGRKSLNFALLDGGKDPFDVVREGMDHALRVAIMDLRPYSSEELSNRMRQGGANAFEAKLRNPITLEAMVVEKLARDFYEKSKRVTQISEAVESKRKRDDEQELPSAKRQKANGPEAADALEIYLARKNLIRHQIMFPLVSREARSPHAGTDDEAWNTSIRELRKGINEALARLRDEERSLLLPLAGKMSEQQIEHIVSATAALQVHDRAQSSEWRMDLPIGSFPPPRLPFSTTQGVPDRGQHASDARATISLRARDYALVNRDLLNFESHASFEASLIDAPTTIESMAAASKNCRDGVKEIFEKRLNLYRERETSTAGRADSEPDRGLHQRVRDGERGP